jgi:hypothetical protein
MKTVKSAPAILKEIMATIAEIKKLHHMQWDAQMDRYYPEGKAAFKHWWEIEGKAYDAKTKAEEAYEKTRSRMTVADGLPADYAELEIKHDAAKAIHDEWDEVWKDLHTLDTEPKHLGFEIGCSLSHYARRAQTLVQLSRQESYDVAVCLKALMEPKEREGTRVRRARQAFYSEWSSGKDHAGSLAFQKVLDELGGVEAEAAKKAAERVADKRQDDEIKELGKKLEKQIRSYLEQAGE